MSVVADLHVHTTNSDGELTLTDIPRSARRCGLEAVGVTDHDRIHPDLDQPVTHIDDVTIIHGIELKTETTDGDRVDLLGYGVHRTPSLLDEIERLQTNRIERGNAIIQRVEEYLDIELTIEAREGIGRPHIARAIANHPDAQYDFQGSFDHLIGDNRPCYIPRDLPTFERGRTILGEACQLVGLAHPLRYDNPERILALASEMDAIERWYPYAHDVDLSIIDRVAAEHDLLRSGGSDAHDTRIGRTGLNPEHYSPIRDRLHSI